MEKAVTIVYQVSGMSCGGCATIVKNKLAAGPGVTSVQVDLTKKEALITSSKTIKADQLQKVLINTGYTISERRNQNAL